MARIIKSVTFRDDLISQIDDLCKHENRSFSNLVELAVIRYLDKFTKDSSSSILGGRFKNLK